MPRNGSNVYETPPGTTAVPNTVITSSQWNAFTDDVAADLNTARPVTAGGTGASSASAARTNLGVVKQTAITDATGGSLLIVGAFGLGGNTHPAATDGDCNLIVRTGVYQGVANTTLNMPDATLDYTIFHTQRSVSPSRSTQIASSTENEIYYRTRGTGANYSPWRRFIGAIEFGSNANGEFVRYADGRIECWHTLQFTAAISTAYLGGFRSATQTWTLPAEYTSGPYFIGTAKLASALSVVGISAATTTSVDFAVTAFSSQSSATRTVTLYAIGE